ncbi:Nuclear pore complex nucleoporin component [Entomophthora muscae]|uniref:Nuclear pore complex nucleoporin component n=2 Tax=Entomophthora muscae TaxID=34485 RepID=A0ACC2SZT8_9FUNG|nr:Nuclear pore complex nucleoporin component [Entomophthora muscae]
MSIHGQRFHIARHPSNFDSKGSHGKLSSDPGFKETLEFLRKPLVTPEILEEKLKDDLKRYMLLNSLKEHVDKVWDDVPSEFFSAMRQGILLAKQEALIGEKARIDSDKEKEAERQRREEEERYKILKAREEEVARLERLAKKQEEERLSNVKNLADLRDKIRASLKKDHFQADIQKSAPQKVVFFQNEIENSEWIQKETLLQAAVLRKCLFLIKNVISRVEERSDLKKKRLDLRKDIRSKLGQIVNSKKKVTEIVDLLDVTLKGLKSDRSLYFWTINFIAKQALKQAETEFSINSTTVYPVARALIGLIQRHFILKDFLLVRFFKKCPYILPGSIPKLDSSSSSDTYRKRLGFVKRDGNEWEDNEHFLLRQGGIFTLFSSLFAFDSTDEEINLFSLADAWFWLHRLLLSPVNLASSIALNKLLETCGFKLIETYGFQTIKLFRYIKAHYIATLDDEYKAHNVRLEICVDKFLKNGYDSEIPEGRNYPVGDGGKWVRTPFRSQNPHKTFVNPYSQASTAHRKVVEEEVEDDESDDGWGAYL